MELRTHRSLAALMTIAALAAASLFAGATPARAASATHTVCASGCDFSTLSAAVAAAADGDIVALEAGEYAGVVTVTKDLTIQGAGNGADASSATIIKGAGSGTGLTLTPATGKHVTLSNVRITNFTTGIIVGSRVTIEDVASTGNASYGISLNDGTTGLTITDSWFTYNSVGFKLASKSTASDMTISGSHFDDNVEVGFYVDRNATTLPTLTDVTITDSTFNNNPIKGFYTERLSDAYFENVEFNNSGNGRPTQGAGLDINLKFGAFSNITLVDVTAIGSGAPGSTENGAGISIAARNDAPSYSAQPASLTGLWVEGATISGATNGLYLGFAISGDVTIEHSKLGGNTVALVNASDADVSAVKNYWGSEAPDFDSLVVGDAEVSPWWRDAAFTTLGFLATPDEPTVRLPTSGNAVIVIPEGVENPVIDVGPIQGQDGSFTVPGDVTVISPSGATLTLLAGTTVTPSDEEWGGEFLPPTIVDLETVTPPGSQASDVVVAVKVGSDEVSFDVDPAARLLLPGGAGSKVGFIAPGGTFTPITTQCAADSPEAGNAVARDCYIAVGEDLVVWTKHFTTFVAYTEVLADSGTDTPWLLALAAGLIALGVGVYDIGRHREREYARL